MNALNIKSAIIATVVLLVWSPLLHAVSIDEVPVSAEGGQTDVEPHEAVEKQIEVNEPEAKPELTSPNQKFAIIADKPTTFAALDAERHYWSVAYVRVEADWARSQKLQDDIEAIRKELYSFATDEEFEDPLPTLADHVIGQETSGISMPSDVFENRLRWMKDHDLVQFVSVLSQSFISADELTLSGFDEIRKKLAATFMTTELSWLCQVQETHGKLEFKRWLLGGHPNPPFKGRSDARLWDVATVAMPVKPTSEVIVIPFFCLSRDRMIREERTKAGHRDLLAFYRRENTNVNAELEGETLGGNSELNLARNPQRLKIMEFRTDGSPEFLASTSLYALRETDASIPGADSESALQPNGLDTPVPGEGLSSQAPQNSAAGGGRFGGGGLADNSRRVYGKEVIVTWSETNDEVRGFSQKTGDWDIIKFDPQKEIVPIVSRNMAAVRFGDSVAAFSGEKCRWDVIELSKDSKEWPMVDDSLVKIEDNAHLYTFAAEKASWTSPTDTTLQPAKLLMKLEIRSSSDAEYSSKCGRLQEEFRKWSDSLPLYKRSDRLIAFHPRQNGTMYLLVARQRWVPEVKSKVEELCRLIENSYSADGLELGIDVTTPNAVATDLEEQIAGLQAKLNALRSTTPDSSEAATKQPDKATLRKQVEQAFDVRQQLQELEAQKLRLKLQLIEANLTTRQKNRDGIIERRVEELLDPNGKATEWNSSGDSKDAATGVAVTDAPVGLQKPTDLPFGMPLTQSSIGLSGPSRLPAGSAEAARPFQKDSTQTVATLPVNVQHAAAAMTWKQSSEIISQLRKAQTAVESRRRHQSQMKEWAREYSEKKKSLTPGSDEYARMEGEIKKLEDENALFTDAHMEDLLRDWTQPWSEYQTQVRLLRFDVEAARASLVPLIRKYDQVQRLVKKGAASEFELERAGSEIDLADIQFRRAEELLKPYTDTEKNEPQLNPDYKASPVVIPEPLRRSDGTPADSEVPKSEPESVSAKSAWDEPQRIKESLRALRKNAVTNQEQVADIKSRLKIYQTPFSNWEPAVRQDFDAAVNATRKNPGAVAHTTKFGPDLKDVSEANRDCYKDAAVIGVTNPIFFDSASVLAAGTDQMLDGIRLDLVQMLEERLAEYSKREELSLAEWKDSWSAYQARLRLFGLDVETAKASLVPLVKKLDRMKQSTSKGWFTESEIGQTESQVKLAEIQLRRAEELLKLYTDIEKNEPQLNPDYQAQSAEAASDADVVPDAKPEQ